MYSYDRRAALESVDSANIRDVFVDIAKASLKHPFEALVAKFESKQTPIGEHFEVTVPVKAPPSTGVMQIRPIFTFYLDVAKQGPKAGKCRLQVTQKYLHGADKVLNEELSTIPQLEAAIGRVLQTHGYEAMSY